MELANELSRTGWKPVLPQALDPFALAQWLDVPIVGLSDFLTEAPAVRHLLEGEPDGLAAYHIKLAGGRLQSVGGDRPSGGEFWVLLRGSLVLGDRTLPAYSCLHRSADEERPVAHAGHEGAELVVLQFPIRDARPRHTPSGAP